MQDANFIKNDFLSAITQIIQENIADERFGVSELAAEVNMSRSNLLRKIKNLTGQSVSQFIRQVRLKEAMEMLRQEKVTVSEVSYAVGFGSTSYFIKCFRDHYGYPPGEVTNIDFNKNDNLQPEDVIAVEEAGRGSIVKFWQELKRRKVVKVIIIYTSISFILLQLLDILIEPLFLPQWMMTLVIVLLGIGFPIAIIFSWIFDITPAGLEVTEPINNKGIVPKEVIKGNKGILSTVLIVFLLIVVVVLVYPKIFGSKDPLNTLKLKSQLQYCPLKTTAMILLIFIS